MFRKIALLVLVLTIALSGCSINGYTFSFNNEHITGSGTLITEDRVVSGFDQVDLKSIGNLAIVIGSEESLTITADDNLMEYITTDVFNHTLEIGMEPNLSLNPSHPIEYELTVTELSSIVLSGFGNINAAELNGEDIEIKLSGSGDITIGELRSENALLRISGFGDLNVDSMVVDQPTLEITGSGDMNVDELQALDLAVKISGFGNADIAGVATKQDIQILGSGNYRAPDLETEETAVRITGFGNATVWAKNNVDVSITGSGDLEYYGSPDVTQSITGFGKIKSLGEH